MRISDWSSDVCSSDLSVSVLESVVTEDQVSVVGRRIAERGVAPRLPFILELVETAVLATIAQVEVDAVITADVRDRARGIPLMATQVEQVAHAQAVLVGIRRLELVVYHAHLPALSRVGRPVTHHPFRSQ